MTHFTVGVIVPSAELANIESFIAKQMEPFDENTEVDPYVSYSLEEAQADLARDIARFERIIQRQDPTYDLEKCREHLARLRITTPDEKYREYIEYHKHFDEDGEPLSTYNPDSKWDWYVIGGRWDGWINDHKTHRESISDNIATTESVLERSRFPHAIITPDGEWHEAGQMGWWGIMLSENEDYQSEVRLLLAQFPNHHIVILDAHI